MNGPRATTSSPTLRDGHGWLEASESRADVTLPPSARLAGAVRESLALRIAMISYYLPSESKIGVGYQVHALANELVRRGHHVDVFSPCAPVDGALTGTCTFRLPARFGPSALPSRCVRRDLPRYDVLHAHGEDYWMWRRRVPVHVRTLHGSCFEEAHAYQGLQGEARAWSCSASPRFSRASWRTRTVLDLAQTRRWTPWVSTVIPNGVDRAFFPSRRRREAAEPTVLFVGTWNGRKRGAAASSRSFAEQVRPQRARCEAAHGHAGCSGQSLPTGVRCPRAA